MKPNTCARCAYYDNDACTRMAELKARRVRALAGNLTGMLASVERYIRRLEGWQREPDGPCAEGQVRVEPVPQAAPRPQRRQGPYLRIRYDKGTSCGVPAFQLTCANTKQHQDLAYWRGKLPTARTIEVWWVQGTQEGDIAYRLSTYDARLHEDRHAPPPRSVKVWSRGRSFMAFLRADGVYVEKRGRR